MKRFLFLAMMLLLLLPATASPDGVALSSPGKDGTENSFVSLDIKIFPNPVRDRQFTVELSTGNISEIRVLNIAGAQVYLKTLPSPVNRFQVVSGNLHNGIYLLRITSDSHITKTVKLMVSNP
jgi:hypothetical protein